MSNAIKKCAIISLALCHYNIDVFKLTIGGAERYCRDLGELLKIQGYDVVFLTKGSKNKTVVLEDGRTFVILKAPNGFKGDIIFSKRVYQYCQNNQITLACYSELQIGFPYCYTKSIALQHGIYWDNPHYKIKNCLQIFRSEFATRRVKKIICVDTNYINWTRARKKVFFDHSEKFVFIPNYADEELFQRNKEELGDNKQYKLLFPRRLDPRRGCDIFINICRILKRDGYDITPILAFEEYNLNDFINKYTDFEMLGCKILHPDFNDINRLYTESYITVIPTVWSEGTSLSAIESIMSGTPVVATYVGGLGNVVINEFNGLIGAPNAEELANKIKKIIDSKELYNRMSLNCKYISRAFTKDRWMKQVLDVIRDYEREE